MQAALSRPFEAAVSVRFLRVGVFDAQNLVTIPHAKLIRRKRMTRTWPEDWESRKRGDSCPFCADLSGRSFYSGRTSEALLERRAIATGHAAVVFRGRHVADLGDLTPEELALYWRDVQHVGRAICRAFEPCHVNYLLLGNLAPHLHVHVVPRYLDDSAPGMPLPWAPSPVPDDIFDRQFTQLRDLTREPNR